MPTGAIPPLKPGDVVRFQPLFSRVRTGRVVRKSGFPGLSAWIVAEEIHGGERYQTIWARRLSRGAIGEFQPGDKVVVTRGVLRGVTGVLVRRVWWFGQRAWLVETTGRGGRRLHSRVTEAVLQRETVGVQHE